MKSIHYSSIVDEVAKLCIDANYYLGEDVICAFQNGIKQETSPNGREILKLLIDNANIAAHERVPMCQDCGIAVVFVDMGQEVSIVGGNINDAITDGVIKGYQEGYLRKSLCDPFTRKNTGDNTPAIIHAKIVHGENLKITIAPKGGGSENMSGIAMLPPSAGVEGVKKFIIERVLEAGPNPCPPIVVGVGIGGNFEKSAILAKEALLRPIGEASQIQEIASLEQELLEKLNKLGIGPQGLGGKTTALAVHVEYYPCHIASLPVAVNINCHANRHKSIVL